MKPIVLNADEPHVRQFVGVALTTKGERIALMAYQEFDKHGEPKTYSYMNSCEPVIMVQALSIVDLQTQIAKLNETGRLHYETPTGRDAMALVQAQQAMNAGFIRPTYSITDQGGLVLGDQDSITVIGVFGDLVKTRDEPDEDDVRFNQNVAGRYSARILPQHVSGYRAPNFPVRPLDRKAYLDLVLDSVSSHVRDQYKYYPAGLYRNMTLDNN